MTRFSSGEPTRFFLAAVANSVATYLLYLGLLLLVSYRWAYTMSYIAGILLSYVLNSLLVFRAPLAWSKAVRFPFVYVAQYGLGLAILSLGVELFRVSEVIMPFVVIAVTMPVSFLLSRALLKSGGVKEKREQPPVSGCSRD